jgi:hypothetical protein
MKNKIDKMLVFLPKNAKLNFSHKELEPPPVKYDSRKSVEKIEDDKIRRHFGRFK